MDTEHNATQQGGSVERQSDGLVSGENISRVDSLLDKLDELISQQKRITELLEALLDMHRASISMTPSEAIISKSVFEDEMRRRGVLLDRSRDKS